MRHFGQSGPEIDIFPASTDSGLLRERTFLGAWTFDARIDRLLLEVIELLGEMPEEGIAELEETIGDLWDFWCADGTRGYPPLRKVVGSATGVSTASRVAPGLVIE
jgi:hypothetical protein